MPRKLTTPFRLLRAAAAVGALACLLTAAPAYAQVVVVANGSPITELDIQQRMKLNQMSNQKVTRQEVISDLIDDRIKISKAKVYGLEVSDGDIESAFNGMATRQRVSVAQFSQVLERAGISPAALKARIRAELTWQQLVRGKFNSSLQVADSDVNSALSSNAQANTVGYVYTLYPITVVVPNGSSDGVIAARRSIAENLRGRFENCNQGLALARSLRDVAVREPVTRSSADLAPALRDLLGGMDIGKLTAPETTPAGINMFALCAKKESTSDSAAKREAREKIFVSRFEAESKKYLEEIRKQAMIEYK